MAINESKMRGMSKDEYDSWQYRQWQGMQNAWPMVFGSMKKSEDPRKPTITLEQWDKARANFEKTRMR